MLKNPRDKIGNELLKGDLVHVKLDELFGEVTEIKPGGILLAGRPDSPALPATVQIRFELNLSVPPQTAIPSIIVVKRPSQKEIAAMTEA